MDSISQHLIAVLNEQIACAEAMLRTLGRENLALLEGDAELLNAAGADKARLVESLEALEGERRSLTQAVEANFAALAEQRSDMRAQPAWQTLIGLIAECKQQNQRNGALVKARSEQVRIALRALRGPETECYDLSGHKPAMRSARPLGTA